MNTNDSGPGSLRQALADAQSGDTINFDAALNGKAITLTTVQLVINTDVTITGPGDKLLAVERSSATGIPEFRILMINPGHTVTISGLTIRNGKLAEGGLGPSAIFESGGGVYNKGSSLTLNDCTLNGNTASGFGGGVYNDGKTASSTVIINRSTLAGNRIFSYKDAEGGAVYNDGPPENAAVTISQSTLSGNSVDYGGGGYGGAAGAIENRGTLTIVNSTVSGNHAGVGTAGGLYNYGNATITNSTFFLNDSRFGGFTIQNSSPGNITVGNTIFYTRERFPGISNDSGASITSLGYNLSDDSANGYLNALGDQINTNPKLGLLQDNGGPTFTHLPAPDSPVVDKGKNLAVNSNNHPIPTDQRGFARPDRFPGSTFAPFGDGSDVGAVELQVRTAPTLGNISTRLTVGTGDNVLITGFIIQGTASKKVIVRGLGPSLAKSGVNNALANPQIELHDTNGTIGINDNWQQTQLGGVIASPQSNDIQLSGLAPSDPAESAIIATLPPGNYTVVVRGVNTSIGVGLAEVYDLSGNSTDAKLSNLSTRGLVQIDDGVMIGGIIVVGQPTRLILRGIGPSLSQSGVPNRLNNPTLEVHDGSSTIATNDDWQQTQIGGAITSDQKQALIDSGLAPNNTSESAMIVVLQPGTYTAILRGVNNTTGVGLLEVYASP